MLFSYRKNNTIIAYLVIFLLGIYNLQGILYTSGSVLSRFILFSLILYGIYSWVYTYIQLNSIILINLVSLFIIVNFCGFLLYTGDYSFSAIEQIKGVLVCFLAFFIGIHLTLRNQINNNVFEYSFYYLLIVYIMGYFRMYSLVSNNLDNENIVNNVAYSFSRLIPLLFFIKRNDLVKLSGLLIIIYFIILGSKRGALITGIIGTIYYLYFFVRKGLKVHNSYYILIYPFLLISFCFLVYNFFISNDFLIQRLSTNDSSGRDVIYETIFNKWFSSQTSIFQILFGFGFISSIDISLSYAHNDWLEILSNFGLLGVILYALILIKFSILPFKLDKNNYTFKIVSLTILSIWFVTTLFSTWYNSLESFMSMLILGHIYVSFILNKR